MPASSPAALSRPLQMSLDEAGFALLDDVFTPSEVAHWNQTLAAAFADAPKGVHVRDDETYSARNVLDLCPEVGDLWRVPPLESVVAGTLGPAAGLVRATYFDKTSGSSWAVPWHKDIVLSVHPPDADAGASGSVSKLWGPVRMKDGIPHAEAPLSVLRKMLQVRINLDDQTDRNGALAVLPGSHRDGKSVLMSGYHATPVYGRAGSAMVLRPLVAHASGHTRDEQTHRRVLALEFAATEELPDGFRWQHFVPAGG